MKNETKPSLRYNEKAISPVLSVLLMIAVSVSAGLVGYSWVMTYHATTTVRAGHAIKIQSVDWKNYQKVYVYVQHVGDGTVTLTDAFIDGVQIETGIDQIVTEGQTFELLVCKGNLSFTNGDRVHIKIICEDGIFTEGTYTVEGI